MEPSIHIKIPSTHVNLFEEVLYDHCQEATEPFVSHGEDVSVDYEAYLGEMFQLLSNLRQSDPDTTFEAAVSVDAAERLALNLESRAYGERGDLSDEYVDGVGELAAYIRNGDRVENGDVGGVLFPHDRRKPFQEAIDLWGKELQHDRAIEECSEYIQSAARFSYGRDDQDDIRDEIADVIIMMNQMAIIFGEEETIQTIEEKMERFKDRITSAKD